MTSLATQYSLVRQLTEKHCALLNIEDYIPQVEEFASPPGWHLAHTTWFFEEMILKHHSSNYQIFNSQFSFLFNSYYNTIGKRNERSNRGAITRPTVSDIYEYRAYVDKHMINLINSALSNELEYLIKLGLNHEQQHQELLITDLKLTFSYNPTFPSYDKNFKENYLSNENEKWIKIDEGLYEIGNNGNEFHYDNEKAYHRQYLYGYKIANTLVKNKEYFEFINDGGYEKSEFWLDEGWQWVKENNITCPLYWKKINEQWYHFTLSGLKKIKLNTSAVHISFYEANAFAAWKGMRLPTEFEWEVASNQFKWGERWEWTNSAYLPYPNFKKDKGAVGEYNGKFMINQMVLRGCSIATSPNHSRNTYRNFFPPETQWQFSGIRLVKEI